MAFIRISKSTAQTQAYTVHKLKCSPELADTITTSQCNVICQRTCIDNIATLGSGLHSSHNSIASNFRSVCSSQLSAVCCKVASYQNHQFLFKGISLILNGLQFAQSA